MTAYCETTDLLTGNIPLPSYLDPVKKVQDAADEIDSYIGKIYVTPVVLPETPAARPARLALKRINAHLASGRLILEVAAAQEDTTLHAYGYSLVQQSLTALQAIQNKQMLLEGAPMVEGAVAQNLPLQYNKEPVSQVDAFYDNIVWSDEPAYLRPRTVWPPYGG